MVRKVVPIVIAFAVVLTIMYKGERRKEPTSSSTAKHVGRHASYSLNVKSTWPQLPEGNASSVVGALATANYYVVLDGSGSMMSHQCGGGTSRIEAAVDAMKSFFATIPTDANIGLAAFDRRTISERVPLGTGNRDALYDALQNIKAGSDTPLRTAIQIGYDKLTAQAKTQLGYGEYHLVVVTDGQPDPRSEDPTPVVQEILAESPVVLHTVGFCIDADHILNQPQRMYYASAANPQELQKGLQAVLAEAPSFTATKFSN